MTLATRLEKIESSGLIRLAQELPELEYTFRHALVQDATYESLLRADRRTLHQAVGRTLESLYPDRLDEIAATLGFHFEKAEELDKAVGYYIRAGEAAARIYALDESIELFCHTLELVPASFSHENLTHLYSQYGRVLELAGRFDAVIEVYEQMCAEAVKRQDLRMELDALMSRAILHSTPSPLHNFAIAMQLCERALSIAQALEDREAQSRIYWSLMLATMFEGKLGESIIYGEQSLELARATGNPERLAFILNDIARCYSSNGLIEKSAAAILEARALWKELGNLPMLVDNLGSSSDYLFLAGEYTQSIAVAEEAYEIAKSIQNIWGQTFCLMILGFSYTERGEIDKAIQVNQKMLSFDPRETLMIAQIATRGHLSDIYTEFGDPETGYKYGAAALGQTRDLEPGLQSAVLAGLVRHDLRMGNLVEAESLFETATSNYDPQNFTTFSPKYIECARNDLLMYKGEFSAALEVLDSFLAILDRLQIVFCLPEFMFRKANALVALGRIDEALALLGEAVSLGERIESRRMLWKIYALIGELQSQSGHPAEAQAAQRKAREHIDFLSDHLPAGLRQSFLKMSAVVKLLQE